jgi:hypothetical protein
MSEIKDGGPAFPHPQGWRKDGSTVGEGLSLRDYFAAKAMQSLILTKWYDDERTVNETKEPLSDDAYELADAMLAARDTDTTER